LLILGFRCRLIDDGNDDDDDDDILGSDTVKKRAVLHCLVHIVHIFELVGLPVCVLRIVALYMPNLQITIVIVLCVPGSSKHGFAISFNYDTGVLACKCSVHF
jgi:hypothetical protein